MKFHSILPLVAVVGLVSGCQTGPAPAPEMSSITCKIPIVAAVPETKEAQEKGGVEIAIVPSTYKAVKKERVTLRQIQPPLAAIILTPGGSHGRQVYVEQATVPYLDVLPARLQFTVRVNNKLPRVFRGQGAVVQFNVGGKLIPFGKVDYKEFLDGIVPPRNETEFTIYGPTLDFLPDKGTIGIFLYDVVTATDTAGNVTEKQNYEWYFSFAMETKEQSAEHQRKQGFMEQGAYERAMLEQARVQ